MKHFCQSLDTFADDENFGIGQIGRIGQKLATGIKSHVNEAPVRDFINFVGDKIWQIVTAGDAKGVSVSAQEETYSTFHQFAAGDVVTRWRDVVRSLELEDYSQESCDLLLHAVISSWLSFVIKDRNDADLPDFDDGDGADRQLNEHEQQAIMYVAGYIPYSLLKTYRRLAEKGNKVAKEFVSIIETWKAVGDQEYSNHGFTNYVQWIHLQDRGGLIKPCASLFMFCRCAEGVAQKTLDGFSVSTLRDCNIKDIILNKLLTSNSVDKCWERLGSKMSPDQSRVLKRKVLEKWTLVRLNAFVQVMVFLMAKKKLCDKRGAQALRKTVDSA